MCQVPVCGTRAKIEKSDKERERENYLQIVNGVFNHFLSIIVRFFTNIMFIFIFLNYWLFMESAVNRRRRFSEICYKLLELQMYLSYVRPV